ncbi:hypothetical protein D3C72_2211090 [compost metagenome]
MIIIAKSHGDQLGAESDTMHALIVLVGGNDAGHLCSVADPVGRTRLLRHVIVSRIANASLELRQVGIQPGVDQGDAHALTACTASID